MDAARVGEKSTPMWLQQGLSRRLYDLLFLTSRMMQFQPQLERVIISFTQATVKSYQSFKSEKMRIYRFPLSFRKIVHKLQNSYYDID